MSDQAEQQRLGMGMANSAACQPEKRPKRCEPIMSSMQGVANAIKLLEDMMAEIVGEPMSPPTAPNDADPIALALLLESLPEAADTYAKRIHVVRERLTDALL